MTKNDEEISRLKALNASLLRKLKGVRAARKRDAENYEKTITNVKNSFDIVVDELQDRKQQANFDYLSYMLCSLQHILVEDGLLTVDQWEGVVDQSDTMYKSFFKKDEK